MKPTAASSLLLLILTLLLIGGHARAASVLDTLDLDAGGTVFAGLGSFAADGTAAGEAAWRRGSETIPLYLLARFSARHEFDDGTTATLFVRVKPYETPGFRADVLPDADEILKDAYVRVVSVSAGEFRLGYQADVRANEAYYAPQVCGCLDGFFGTNTPEATLAHGPVPENSTAADLDSRAAKIAWYSPAEDGFRLAASYAPGRSMGRPIDGRLDDLGQSYTAPGLRPVGELKDGRLDEFWSAALEWSGSTDEVAIGVESGISGASPDGALIVPGRNEASPLVWDAGFSVSYAAWKAGAAYEQQNFIDLEGIYGASAYQPPPGSAGTAFYLPPATNGIVTRTFDVGVTYTIGPVTLGAAWSRAYYEGLVDAASPKLAAANDVVFGGGQFQVTPAVAVLAGLQVNSYAPEATGPHPLPASVSLDRVYGGSNATLNIWDRQYSSVALLVGIAARF